MRVVVPGPLARYTGNRREVQAEGRTLAQLVSDLDRRYPGIRLGMVDEQDALRTHIKIFVNREQARGLSRPLTPGDEVLIVAELSGG